MCSKRPFVEHTHMMLLRVLCTSAPGFRFGYRLHPYPPKSDRQLSQFAVKIRNFENFKLGTDFEARPSAAVSRIDGSGFPVNVPDCAETRRWLMPRLECAGRGRDSG